MHKAPAPLQRRGLFAVVVIICAGCAGAAPQPAPTTHSPFEAREGFVLYDISLSVDTGRAEIAAQAEITYLADRSTADSVTFLLGRDLSVEALQGPAVLGYRTVPLPGDSSSAGVTISLHDSIDPGSVVTFELTYSGRPTFPVSGINQISADWIELGLDSGWHPWMLRRHHMVGTLRLSLPETWQVIASGTVLKQDGQFVVHNTVPQPDAGFVAVPSLEKIGSEEFQVYFRPEDQPVAPSVMNAARNCARDLNRQFGAFKALPQGRIVLAERKTGGYARTNYFVLSEVNPDPVRVHRFLCHELAHFWTVSAASAADHWMTEAFAEYVAGRSVKTHFGEVAFEKYVQQWGEEAAEHGPIWSHDATQRATSGAMYRRAPHLLARLERRIGSSQMDAFLSTYMSGEVTTTAELLDHLQRIAGSGVEDWFRAELLRSESDLRSQHKHQ